ncbi:hypothetical protein GGS20DRAFT_336200 [Poronia punctata]|nr:hypothetical protein GGS20DRAFT_336200 [Poronia punctata]
MAIPGLHILPSMNDLERSCLYITAPSRPEYATGSELFDLACIFHQFGVQNLFGLHYLTLPDNLLMNPDDILLGKPLTAFPGFWTRAVPRSAVNPADLHGHIFRLIGRYSWSIWEYREGPAVDVGGVDPAFFIAVAEYLDDHGLNARLGLRVRRQDDPEFWVDFCLMLNGNVRIGSEYLLEPYSTDRICSSAVVKDCEYDFQWCESRDEGTRRISRDVDLVDQPQLALLFWSHDIIRKERVRSDWARFLFQSCRPLETTPGEYLHST